MIGALRIDGAQGEGGGQILRSALALSMVTGQSFEVTNLRAKRSKPGLMRQHLTSVLAARDVCAGSVEGAELGSTTLRFTPGTVRGGAYDFAIGTAGSTTLVLQTVLPALLTVAESSTITISGGTHNMHAPSVHFLQRAFLPLVQRMGASVTIDLERHGFYPAGGGRIRATIEPVDRLKPFELLDCAPITARRATALVAGLSGSIAQRELAVVAEKLGWADAQLHIRQLDADVGPGNILSVEIERGDVVEVFTGFGARGVSAEAVANRAVDDARAYLAAKVPVWRHLADQIMLPLALAGGGAYLTGPLSGHAVTNAAVIESFLPVTVHRAEDGDGRWRVTIEERARRAGRDLH